MLHGLLTILLASSFSPQRVKMARRDYFPISPTTFPASTSTSSDPVRPNLPYFPFPSSSIRRPYYPVKSEEPTMPLRSANYPRTSISTRRTFTNRRRIQPTILPNLVKSKSPASNERSPPDLNPISNQEEEKEEICPRVLPPPESNCSVLPSQAPSLPSPTIPPNPISPGYAFFRDASEVMLDPSLPAGTPYASNPGWESPRVRQNSSQTMVAGQVEVENDPHLESATLINGGRRGRGSRRRQGRIISIFSLVRCKQLLFPNTRSLTDKNHAAALGE